MPKSQVNYIAEMDARICGIPCIIGVTHFHEDPGSYYEPGDIEVEFDILDRKGYFAPWLEKKMNWRDESKLYDQVIEYMHY